MKRVAMLFVLVIALATVGGCTEGEGHVSFTYEIFYVDSMPCLATDGIQAGGVTCDWSKYEEHTND